MAQDTLARALAIGAKAELNDKQNKLTAGANITIVDNVISASGELSSVEWGQISGSISNQTDLSQALASKANASDLSSHTDNSNIHVTSVEKASWDAKSDFSGDYDDLTNKPTLPEKTSDLTNDSGFITSSDLSGYATTSYVDGEIAAVEAEIPDISGLATKAELSAVEAEIPDITGLATETYVDTAVATKSVVSGQYTSDNWTSITINGTSKNIPIGGGTSYVAGNGIDITGATISIDNTVALKSDLNNKQDTLTAGTNITIVDNVISATGGGGEGTVKSVNNAEPDDDGNVEINGYDIMFDSESTESLSYKIDNLESALEDKQDTLTAGTNITITNNVISATGFPIISTTAPTQDAPDDGVLRIVKLDSAPSTYYNGYMYFIAE